MSLFLIITFYQNILPCLCAEDFILQVNTLSVELFRIYQQLLLRENIIVVKSVANTFLFLSKGYCLLIIKGWTLAEYDMVQHLRGSNILKPAKQGKMNDNWKKASELKAFFQMRGIKICDVCNDTCRTRRKKWAWKKT